MKVDILFDNDFDTNIFWSAFWELVLKDTKSSTIYTGLVNFFSAMDYLETKQSILHSDRVYMH